MAVIEILGTDSLSSSRITLNDNFVELQDRVDDISTYLDTTAATITGVAITATQLSVSGGSTLINVTASDITLSGSADFQGTVFKTAVEGSMASGVTSFATTFSSHTYFVQDTGTPNITSWPTWSRNNVNSRYGRKCYIRSFNNIWNQHG
jgi:hypothetical protein